MGFADPVNDYYRLLPTSAVRPLGSDLALPLTDILGELRTEPVPGAYT